MGFSSGFVEDFERAACGLHIVRDERYGPPIIYFKAVGRLLTFLLTNPRPLHLYPRVVSVAPYARAMVLSCCIEDHFDEPQMIHAPFPLAKRLLLSEALENGTADVLFIDPCGRLLATSTAALVASDMVRALLSSPMACVHTPDMDRAVVAAAERVFPHEASAPRISLAIERRDPADFPPVTLEWDIGIPGWHDNAMSATPRSLADAHEGTKLENDTAHVLSGILSPANIFVQPRNADDKYEFCDVLVVTDTDIMIVQSKARLHSTVGNAREARKAADAVKRQAQEALSQCVGSLTKMRKTGFLEIMVGMRKGIAGSHPDWIERLRIYEEIGITHYEVLDDRVRIDTKSKRIVLVALLDEAYRDTAPRIRPVVEEMMDRLNVGVRLLTLHQLHALVMTASHPTVFFDDIHRPVGLQGAAA